MKKGRHRNGEPTKGLENHNEITCLWGLEYADCTLCWDVRPSPLTKKKKKEKKMGCPEYDTKLYLIVRLQFWISAECGVARPSLP